MTSHRLVGLLVSLACCVGAVASPSVFADEPAATQPSSASADVTEDAEVAEGETGSMGLIKAENAPRRWVVVNDNVMGGRSKGGFEFEDGRLIFSGSTNTRGGGYSSIRARVPNGSLKGADGVELRVKGDARTYQVGFYTDLGFRGIPAPYRAEFTLDPEQEGWQTVRIAFEDAKPSWLGRPLRRYPELDPAKIRIFDFFIFDQKDGPFRLEVDGVGWYAGPNEDTTASQRGESDSAASD